MGTHVEEISFVEINVQIASYVASYIRERESRYIQINIYTTL